MFTQNTLAGINEAHIHKLSFGSIGHKLSITVTGVEISDENFVPLQNVPEFRLRSKLSIPGNSNLSLIFMIPRAYQNRIDMTISNRGEPFNLISTPTVKTTQPSYPPHFYVVENLTAGDGVILQAYQNSPMFRINMADFEV